MCIFTLKSEILNFILFKITYHAIVIANVSDRYSLTNT